jgi:multicomponent Na+:H+ antiporter subunit F
MIEIVTTISLAMLGVAILLVLVRIIRGPTLADRVLGLDVLTLLGVGVLGAFAARTGLFSYVDLAVGLALVGFLSTAALARYLITRPAQ